MAKDYFGIIKKKVADFLSEKDLSKIPTENKSEKDIVSYVEKLYNDSLEWRKHSFKGRTSSTDVAGGGIDDPAIFWKKCRDLCSGRHWEVWGRRNNTQDDAWRHEVIWTAIEDQKRARKTYLAGWHDVTVSPNIQHINEVLSSERDKTQWRETMNLFVDKALTEGTAFTKKVLDTEDDPDGVVKEIPIDNESIFPTPYSTSLKKEDGCWYVVYASMQNVDQVVKKYPKLDRVKLEQISARRAQEVSATGEFSPAKYTKLVCVLEAWVDDDKLEKVELDPQELQERITAISEGIAPKVYPDDDHEGFIKGYRLWMEHINQYKPATPEDQQKLEAINELTLSIIEEHIEAFQKNPHPKQREKYPCGRKIVVVGDQLAEDVPNPFKVWWRKLFHKYDMEKVPNSFWGRGIPEILWHSNKMLDTFLSRAADMSLTASMPEKWLRIQDKDLMKAAGITYSNDPTELKYYEGAPPIHIQATMPQEFVLMINQMKESLEQKIGVNQVTRGESPGSHASGDLVELLLRQNQTQLTGEANDNLNDVVEEIIETRLELYKAWYKEPRYYMINGTPTAIRVSDILTYYTVKDDKGQLVQKEIPMLQVRVKQNSNFPNQWEYDLSFAMKLAGTTFADGSTAAPKQFFYDVMSAQYPEFAVGGKYYQASQAEQVGMQVIAEQQAKQQEEQKTLDAVKQKFMSEGMKHIMKHQPPSHVEQQVLSQQTESQ